MKRILSVLGVIGATALLMAAPVPAEMMPVSDADLEGISGKGQIEFTGSVLNVRHTLNLYQFIGEVDSGLSVGNNSNSNLQVGWFQWSDSHAGDLSNQKGANFFGASSATNQVQQNVVAIANAITWGARATGLAVYGDTTLTGPNSLGVVPASAAFASDGSTYSSVDLTQESMGYATMYLGGF